MIDRLKWLLMRFRRKVHEIEIKQLLTQLNSFWLRCYRPRTNNTPLPSRHNKKPRKLVSSRLSKPPLSSRFLSSRKTRQSNFQLLMTLRQLFLTLETTTCYALRTSTTTTFWQWKELLCKNCLYQSLVTKSLNLSVLSKHTDWKMNWMMTLTRSCLLSRQSFKLMSHYSSIWCSRPHKRPPHRTPILHKSYRRDVVALVTLWKNAEFEK